MITMGTFKNGNLALLQQVDKGFIVSCIKGSKTAFKTSVATLEEAYYWFEYAKRY